MHLQRHGEPHGSVNQAGTLPTPFPVGHCPQKLGSQGCSQHLPGFPCKAQQGQRRQGLCNRTFLEDQAEGTNSANRGTVLVVRPGSHVHSCAMNKVSFFNIPHVVFAVLCLGGRTPRIRNARHCFKTHTLAQVPLMVPCHLQDREHPLTWHSRPTPISSGLAPPSACVTLAQHYSLQ